ncbi:MAG: sulfotransferase [Geminicoccaceae bacterium]|nr:sulfotransferase [Geminicoccaceae bacterium]
MRLPDFIVAGAAKSGTTSLYQYLAEHPDIFMSEVKEPNFFAFEDGRLNLKGALDEERMFQLMHRKSVTDPAAYEALFAAARSDQTVGEASPRYLYAPQAAPAIRAALGPVKLIVILRDPVARAYSHFQMNRRRGLEPLERFADALDAEDARVAEGWEWDYHYVRLGLYATQVRRLFDTFGRERVHVELYDDLRRDPQGLMRRCYGFVGVDPSFVPQLEKRHKVALGDGRGPLARLAFAPEDTALGRLAYKLVPRKAGYAAQDLLQHLVGRMKKAELPPIEPADAARLHERFTAEVDELERLIDRDLRTWRRPVAATSSASGES